MTKNIILNGLEVAKLNLKIDGSNGRSIHDYGSDESLVDEGFFL